MRALPRASALSAFVALLAPLALAQEPPGAAEVSYSADYTMETAEGAMSGKVNVAPGKERREDFTPDGETMISIRRDDLGKLWMLMPSERMYMEMDLGAAQGDASSVPRPEDFQTQMTEEGQESVNGLMTTKSKVVMTDADGSKMGGYWWTTDDGILVKMDVIALTDGEKTRLKRELTNVVVGPQDAALFEIPKGYSPMMMGMGAEMLGLPGAQDAGAGEAGGQDAAGEAEQSGEFDLGGLKNLLESVQ